MALGAEFIEDEAGGGLLGVEAEGGLGEAAGIGRVAAGVVGDGGANKEDGIGVIEDGGAAKILEGAGEVPGFQGENAAEVEGIGEAGDGGRSKRISDWMGMEATVLARGMAAGEGSPQA